MWDLYVSDGEKLFIRRYEIMAKNSNRSVNKTTV